MRYRRYEGLCNILETRYEKYNDTMKFIDQLETRGEVFVIRPQEYLKAGRAERNKGRLYAVYDLGYSDAASRYAALRAYLDCGG
jgi:predicted patatin/cPLA2 family phospholipase